MSDEKESANLGRYVATLRKRLGLRIEDAYQRAGVGRTTWIRIENGQQIPGRTVMAKVASALQVDLEDLQKVAYPQVRIATEADYRNQEDLTSVADEYREESGVHAPPSGIAELIDGLYSIRASQTTLSRAIQRHVELLNQIVDPRNSEVLQANQDDFLAQLSIFVTKLEDMLPERADKYAEIQYRRLPRVAQRALLILWSFPGGATRPSIERSLNDDDLVTEIGQALENLVHRRLVQIEIPPILESNNIGWLRRYILPDATRDGIGRILDEEILKIMQEKLLEEVLSLARDSSGAEDGIENLKREQRNIDAALEYCFQPASDPEKAMQLGYYLRHYWHRTGQLRKGSRALSRLLAREDTKISSVWRVKVLNVLGELEGRESRYDVAQAHFDEALALAKNLVDQQICGPEEIANCYNNLAMLREVHGDTMGALLYYRDVEEIDRKSGNIEYLATTLNQIGRMLVSQGRFEEAILNQRESFNLYEQILKRQQAAYSLGALAETYYAMKEYPLAEEHYIESLRRLSKSGATNAVVECLEGLAKVAARTGRFDRAIYLFEGALKIRDADDAKLPPHDAAEYDREQRAMAEEMGQEAIAQTRIKAHKDTRDEIIVHALTDAGITPGNSE